MAHPFFSSRYFSYAIILVIIIAAVAFTGPALTGNIIAKGASSQNQPPPNATSKTTIEDSLKLIGNNITACYDLANKLNNQAETCGKDRGECELKLKTADADYLKVQKTCESNIASVSADFENKVESLGSQLNITTASYNDLRSQFDQLANNTARNICCKARVDNSNIKYYIVENNKIACSETTGLELSCN